jgi:IPT/TIG domain-containing protein
MSLVRGLRPVLQFWLVLFLFISFAGCGGGGTGGGSTPITPPPPAPTLTLAISQVSSFPLIIAASDSFFVTVTATASGTSATPTITLGTLPAGLSTSSTFPMSVPSGGANVYFTTSSSIAAGSDTISISGTAGGASATASLTFTVVSGTPNQLGFTIPDSNEVQVAQGGSATISEAFISTNTNNPLYDVTLSAIGLPPGVTASFSPQVVEAGGADDEWFTVTLTASNTAPLAQNVQWGIVATPTSAVPATTENYVMDVTPAGGGAGWNNQTNYISTRATPFAAVYDPVHKLIYSANQVWDRIDIINDQTHAIAKSISIQDPIGLDISVDGSTVWVTTECQVMYGIDTTTLQATRYILPRYGVTSTYAGTSWEGAEVFSLADGTVLLVFSSASGSDEDGYPEGAIWNPTTGSFTQLVPPDAFGWETVARSGDGTRVFSIGGFAGGSSYIYDVLTHTFSSAITNAGLPEYAGQAAVNWDGSRVAVAGFGGGGFALFDGNLNLVGPLPGDGAGFVFSPDGQTIYEETAALASMPVIDRISVSTQQSISLAPAMLEEGWFGGGSIPWPFAVDSSGMVLGIQNFGIAFDDSNATVTPAADQPGSPPYMGHISPFSGPLSGGTFSSVGGNAFSITPDAYYGGVKGPSALGSIELGVGTVGITSPPAQTPGPVDLKMLFPDGTEIYDPLIFTYGAKLMDAIVSGGGPEGGAGATLDAYGIIPQVPADNTVTVGGSTATNTTGWTQYPTFTGELTAQSLSFTAPSGAPGWADVALTTPNGTSTLSKSFFFAKSVNDYTTADSPTFVLYDKTRNQLYLSAGNHIDVFSLASNSFISPLTSPVTGSQFQGLALTPDGKNLLATDLTNGGLVVINPDSPSGSYEIALAGSQSSYNECAVGPIFVAADNQGNALVSSGAAVGQPSCGPLDNPLFIANLSARTGSKLNVASCGAPFTSASYLGASRDGSLIGIAGGFKIYLPTQQVCIPVANPAMQQAVTVSGDGNVLGLDRAFINASGNILGRFAYPTIFYPSASSYSYYNYTPYADGALQNPTLNDPGSLYYWAYPSYINIVDVQHGTPALRFGLTETVTNTVSPMAIDSSGQHIFLITNKGLTIVNLGNAPLSVGHFSETSTIPGNQIMVRGSGFEDGVTATLGGVPASLTFTDAETLTLTIPAANPGQEDLVLTNPDGTTYTLQNAISVQ